jgi:hypothetical protein
MEKSGRKEEKQLNVGKHRKLGGQNTNTVFTKKVHSTTCYFEYGNGVCIAKDGIFVE